METLNGSIGKSGLRLAVVAGAIGGELRQIPRLAREAGFGGVELNVVGGGVDLTELSSTGRREVARLWSGQGVELAALRVEVGPAGLKGAVDIDRILARFDQILETTAGLSSNLLCVDIGPLPAPAVVEKPRKQIKPEEAGLIILPGPADLAEQEPPTAPAVPPDAAFVSQVDMALGELGRRADRYGVRVALRSELAGFAAIARALEAVACPWFGLDLDPVALLADDWKLDQVLGAMGSVIWHLRGRDAHLGDQRRTKPAVIGQGSVNWAALLGELNAGGYHGWVGVDPLELADRQSAALTGAKYLMSL